MVDWHTNILLTRQRMVVLQVFQPTHLPNRESLTMVRILHIYLYVVGPVL